MAKKMMGKYYFSALIRISNDSAGSQRFTEEEIKECLKNGTAHFKRPNESLLIIRDSDGAVMGEFLT